jgi:hypothetical protein
MLRAQQLARQDVNTDKGYAMMMTSIITIMLFSLMGAFLTMTNLAKSSTDAYIDGNNTFYAAESGLNRRASELYQRFRNYNAPTDGATTTAQRSDPIFRPTAMSTCYGSTTAPILGRDLECRLYDFKYNNNIARTAGASADTTVLSEGDNNSSTVRYKAYTFVSDKTNYDNTLTPPAPVSSTIPAGSTYAGLFAQEYIYTVNATAAKLNDNLTNNTSQIGSSGDNKTVLQMDFKSRTIPLFQFGAFYEGDLELNPSRAMSFNGRMHTNSSMYITAGTAANTPLTIDGAVTAVQNIYTGNPALSSTYSAAGTVRIEKTAGAQAPGSTLTSSIQNLPSTSTPTTAAEVSNLNPYNQRLKSALGNKLVVPPVAFLTKVDNTKPNNIGEYYGKADLRLEMFPNRSVPFTLQVIKSGFTTPSTSCSTGVFANTVSADRAEYSNLRCSNLSEGQLRSLMQPILVRPTGTEEYNAFCSNPTGEVRTRSKVSTTPVLLPAITNPQVQERIIDALALTIAAQTTPVRYSDLEQPLSAPAQTQFGLLLAKIIPTPSPAEAADIVRLQAATPVAIAALSTTKADGNVTGSCFRPAPIQALFDPAGFSSATALAADTPTNFKDRRENRFIRMLQTNIESLTLWNRDGLFVPGADTFTNNVAALAGNFTIVSGVWTNQSDSSSNNLLFTKDPIVTTAPTRSFRLLGLAARDRTEGGLVIHATIDRTAATGNPDYNYTGRTSPYGFAFNDGANLPAPLTIVTDQAAYSQGNWNVLNIDKQPASFLADTVTVLSNSCLATADTGNTSSTAWASTTVGTGFDTRILPPSLAGQINCGSISGAPTLGSTTIVNAAFLAKTDTSIQTPAASKYYSGGLNNYMRILEDWRGSTMTYRGSFVSLGEPLEVSGRYKECKNLNSQKAENYACPATLRDWDYDITFNSFVGLPPLPPTVIELTQDSFKRKYN